MQTIMPNLKVGRDVWDKATMPETEFAGRVEHLTRWMGEQNLAALLLFGTTADDYAYPAYLTNYMVRIPQGVLAVLTGAGRVVICPEGPARNLPAFRAASCADDVRPCMDTAKEAAKVLQEAGITSGRIGVAGLTGLMGHAQHQTLREGIGSAELIDVEPALATIRRVKSPVETEQLRRSTGLAAKALAGLDGHQAEQHTGRSVDAHLIRLARRGGAEDVRVLLGTPEGEGWHFLPSTPEPLPKGTYGIYLAVQRERYWAEQMGTFTLTGDGWKRSAAPEAEGLLTALRGMVRPGATPHAIQAALREEASKKGLTMAEGICLLEGIGLSPHEAPHPDLNGETPLAEGECLALRVACGGSSGPQTVGETVRVGPDGGESLRD